MANAIVRYPARGQALEIYAMRLKVTANIIDKVYEKGKKACSSIYVFL